VAKSKNFVFEGFRFPRYTQVPDELFDVLMPDLTEAEIKCLLYIVRRTFGFRKESDAIAAKQFVEGIVTRDGRQLDRGTGLSNKGVWSGLKGLEEKGIIEVERRMAPDGDYEINVYRLRFHVSEEGVTTLGSNPYYLRKEPPTTTGSTQQTVIQETVVQKTDDSKDISKGKKHSEDIARTISDFSQQVFHDEEHIASNIAQAHNLWKASGLSEEEFVSLLHAAKATTLKKSGSIKRVADERTGLKNRAPYFFAVLKGLAKGTKE
jgi:hypothetical protein